MPEDPTRDDWSSSRHGRTGDSNAPRRRRGQQEREKAGSAETRPIGEAASSAEPAAAAAQPAAEQNRDVQADTERSLDELTSLQAELESAKDHALRCRAEMENFKKRLARQVEEERRYALLPIMQDLLPVLDNMNRAINAAQTTDGGDGLREGFCMVAQQLQAILAKYDCREIEALGKPFDPHLHQAVGQQASAELPANTVVSVVEPGYQLHDRVVRPTKVIVSTSNP